MLGTAIALSVVGLCVGSFLTALVERSDEGFAGLATGRSRCRSCGHPLGPADLVPIASWLWLGRHCRHCGASLSVAYPLTEGSAALIGAAVGWLLPTTAAVLAATLGWWLLGLALIDLRSFRLPDVMTLPLIPAGIAVALGADRLDLLAPTPLFSAVGAGAGFGLLYGVRWIYQRLRGQEGLGLGDAKLCAAAGAWLGLDMLSWLILLAGLIGLCGALVVHRSLRGQLAIPFGPALSAAFWLLFVFVQLG